MTIGERLREKRKMMKLTAKELSERSGVPEKTIYRIEKDDNADPKISSLKPLIEALECSADEIIMEREKKGLSGMLEELFNKTENLPAYEKSLLIQIVDKWIKSVHIEEMYKENLGDLASTKIEASEELRDKKLEEMLEEEQLKEFEERHNVKVIR